MFPSIQADRVIKALYEEGRDYEAELASAEMGVELQAILRGEIPEKKERDLPTQAQGGAELPRLGIGNEITPSKKAAELGATPRGGA